MKNETVILTAHFPTDLELSARVEAAKLRISKSELVRQAVTDFLKRLTNNPPTPPQEAHHDQAA